MCPNYRSSSATSTLSSRTSGVSSGETGSSSTSSPDSPNNHKIQSQFSPQDVSKQNNKVSKKSVSYYNGGSTTIESSSSLRRRYQDNDSAILLPPYQRRYATLTKPKPHSPHGRTTIGGSSAKSGMLYRNHSFQVVSNRQKLIQSENSAFFKVPSIADLKQPLTLLSTPPCTGNNSTLNGGNTAKFFAKESHPNKFLTSTPIKESSLQGFNPVHKAAPPAIRKPVRQASFTAASTTASAGPQRRLLPQIGGLISGGKNIPFRSIGGSDSNSDINGKITVEADTNENHAFIGIYHCALKLNLF